MNNIQLQYQSVIKTPNLWNSTSSTFYNLEHYAIPQKKICKISYEFFDKNLRLGHKVEYFLNHFLSIECGNDLLLKNTQISASPQETLGEIDAIIKVKEDIFHLEYSYKFYLFDGKSKEPFVNRWIGPNKKDSLNRKLKKLKENQLPLLYHKKTRQLLEHHNLNLGDIKQRIILKTQLFVPLNLTLNNYNGINPEAIAGLHLQLNQLINYSSCKFFIPAKHDWLIPIQKNVNWVSFHTVYSKIMNFHEKQLSPMVWIKFHSGQLLKCFVTWW